MTEVRSFSDVISFEILSYEKRHGKRPKHLIVSEDLKDKLFSECFETVMKYKNLKFENPVNDIRQYMGMNLIVVEITFGGSFKWALGN